MTEASDRGLKSAFDLAMERMAKTGDGLQKLSAEQKQAIAEVTSRTKARIAELEILFQKKLADAQVGNDPEKIKGVEELQRTEIQKLRRKEAEETERIRKSG